MKCVISLYGNMELLYTRAYLIISKKCPYFKTPPSTHIVGYDPYEWGPTSPQQKVTNRLTVAVTES